jgi:hypothetical protein
MADARATRSRRGAAAGDDLVECAGEVAIGAGGEPGSPRWNASSCESALVLRSVEERSMMGPRSLVRLAVLGVAIACPGVAAAGTASFSIPAGAMIPDGAAALVPAALQLPDQSGPRVFFNFVLPRDYVSNTDVTIVLHYGSLSTSCQFLLVPDTATQRRPGVPADAAIETFVPKNGSNLLAAPSSVLVPSQKAYVLKPGGAIPGMRKGDQFLLGLIRGGDDAEDTCDGHLLVQAVDVRYTTP